MIYPELIVKARNMINIIYKEQGGNGKVLSRI